MRKIYLFIALIFISFILRAQFGDIYLGNWIINKVETIDSTAIYNDLNFTRMQIRTQANIDLYRGNPIDEFNRLMHTCKYTIFDKKFQIKCDSLAEFEIEKITDAEFIFKRNNARYYFNKMLIEKQTGIFRKKDYKIIERDTLDIQFRPIFDGDIIKFFSIDEDSKSTLLVGASFILKKNKQIDSIKILTLDIDSTTIIKTIDIIQKSRKKWIPSSTLNYKKIESKVYIFVLFGSSDLSKLTQLNIIDKGNKIFTKGIEFHDNNQFELAESFYTSFISLYQYIIYNTYYIGLGGAPGYIESLNNGLFNRAAVRFALGRVEDACKDLKQVSGNKKDAEEAEKYIKEYCK